MAYLISALSSGFSDAPSGKAIIYAKGTTTATSVYSDPAGSSLITPAATATYTLDADGRLECYVDGLVDVTIQDASSNVVFGPFTPQQGDTGVAVSHAHFTGANLDEVLDDAYTSFGADDFNVSFRGSPTAIKTAIEAVDGRVFNVRAAAYGATGNGTNDDTAAIIAAITACNAAGGGTVEFPAPSNAYKLTSELIVPSGAKIKFRGSGRSCVLRQTGATPIFRVDSGAATCDFEGLAMTYVGAAASGAMIKSSVSGNRLTVDRCFFIGNASASSGQMIDLSSGGTIFVRQSSFTFANALDFALAIANSSNAFFSECDFSYSGITSTSASAVIAGTGGFIDIKGCVYTAPSSGSATFCSSTANIVAANNTLATGGATLTGFNVGGTGMLREANTIIPTGTLYTGSGTPTTASVISQTRDGTFTRTTGTATSYTPAISSAGTHVIESSGASMAINNPTGYYCPGQEVVIIYANTTGGAITPTFGTQYKIPTVTAVASARRSAYRFIVTYTSGLGLFLQAAGWSESIA